MHIFFVLVCRVKIYSPARLSMTHWKTTGGSIKQEVWEININNEKKQQFFVVQSSGFHPDDRMFSNECCAFRKKKSLGFLTQPSHNKIERFPGKRMQKNIFLTMAVWCRKWPRCHFLSSCFVCELCLTWRVCLLAHPGGLIRKVRRERAFIHYPSVSCFANKRREGRGKARWRRTRGRWDAGAPQGVGVQTWGHIKSIQLKHELQGSLSISKPMKVTIHQKRVPWRCCKASCGHARTHAALR